MADKEVIHVPGLSEAEEKANVPLSAAIKANGFVFVSGLPPIDPATGNPNQLLDVTIVPANDSGGAGAVSTASDYLRFVQMLLDGGRPIEGNRSRKEHEDG